jgi:putative endopeptidase
MSHDTRRRERIPSKPDIPPPQKTIKPGTDFYKFVNGGWLRHAKMPPYLSSYGVSEEIEDQINKELLEILLHARTIVRTHMDRDIPHTTYLLGTFVESALNTQSQQNNVQFVKKLVNQLNCIRDTKDVAATFADFMKHQIKCLLEFVVIPMETDSGIYRLALVHGDLGLPDASYYHSRSIAKQRTVLAYSKLLKKLSEDFDVEGLERIVGLEIEAAAEIMKSRQDDEVLLRGSELMDSYRHIPWEHLFESALGWTPSRFHSFQILIPSKSWISYINRCFRSFTMDTWKVLFAAQMLLHALPILPPPYDDMEFQLFGHRLRGQTEKVPQHRLALKLSQEWLRASLGDAFVKKHVPPSLKENALDLAREIRAAAAKRAGSVEWLLPETRKKAASKVRNIHLGVAYPAEIEKDKKTTLNPEQLLKNVLDLAFLDFENEIEKVNKPLNPANWDDAVFAVNAYYYNEGNRLILPSGILRWPFYHVAASDGWNFGGLGATIGHEICHAFDNDGKDYDETGNRNPWWSRKEQTEYIKKTKALIELYNQSTYFGYHLSGELTLSENIADLGGLAIALLALKERLDRKGVQGAARKKELCEFFMSFAVSWRTKEKKEKAMQSLFMDSHAPPMVRTNNIVSQFDDWYECFGVKPGEPLYRDPSHRIRIF